MEVQRHWEYLLAKLDRDEQLSSDELSALSTEEKEFINAIESKEELKQLISFLATVDNEKQWIELEAKIAKAEKPAVPLWTKLLRYAAILLIPIMLGLFYIKRNASENAPVQIAMQHKKATLQLSDGSSVDLGELSNADLLNESGVKINNKDTTLLTYQSLQTTKQLKYNKLIVPRGGEYSLLLDDGTKIFVNAQSVLRFPISFQSANTREVYLEAGEAYFEVAKNPLKPFIVHANNNAVKVLGTSFNINFYSPTIITTLVEGHVKTGLINKKMIDLYPNEQSIFNSLSGEITKSTVDVEAAVAWKDGFIIFEDQDLSHVMNLLGRWYDFDVVFEDETLKNQHFNAKIKKYNNITDVLSIIEQTGRSKFKILNGKIHVLKK